MSENEWVTMEVRGHYFMLIYKENAILDIGAAKRIVAEAVAFAGENTYPALTDIRKMPPHGKDVRDYFANEASSSSLANAILVSSSFSKLLANIFLTLSKPKIPTKLFTDETKATKWLELFPVKQKKVLV